MEQQLADKLAQQQADLDEQLAFVQVGPGPGPADNWEGVHSFPRRLHRGPDTASLCSHLQQAGSSLALGSGGTRFCLHLPVCAS